MRRAGASIKDCRSMSRRPCRAQPWTSCVPWAIKSKSFRTATRILAPANSSGAWATRRSKATLPRAIHGATAKRWAIDLLVDANGTHHSAILVLEQMTVIDQRADGVRISKVHAQPDARIL